LPEEKEQYRSWGEETMSVADYYDLPAEERVKVARYEAGPPRERRAAIHTMTARLVFNSDGTENWQKCSQSRDTSGMVERSGG
jgi:hypothetical protein